MAEQDLTYSVIFDIPKNPISVDEFAKGMQETLSSLEEMNNAIACGINTSIKVISYIESIEAGSIEFKLKDDAKLEKDEKALEVLSASLTTVATGELPQYINGHITIYSPVFDATKTKWKFKYNNNTETIDISKTNIANFILKRGKVVVGDCFKVKLEIVEKKTKNGYKNDYSVVEVLGFIEGKEQKEFQYSFKKEDEEENS